MKITVIGAGNGGLAMAGDLAKRFKVNLYSPFAKEIKSITEVILEGKINGSGKLSLVTTNIERAIQGAEIIMVVVPAFAHGPIAEECAPYLQNGQIIVLNPGRTGGALEFNHVLEKMNVKADITIAETNTLVYACRKTNSNKVLIHGVKNKVLLAALPATKTKKIIKKIQVLYPQFQPAENVLETSLDNIGAVFHPAIMLNEESPTFYNITLKTAELLEKIDKERLEIAEAFGIKLRSAVRWLEETYNAKGKTLYEKIINNKAYKKINRPKGFDVRQIAEDIPYGLVPIALLGRKIGASTSFSDVTINKCCFLLNRNLWQQGRNLEKIGLSGMNIDKIKDFVNYGRKK